MPHRSWRAARVAGALLLIGSTAGLGGCAPPLVLERPLSAAPADLPGQTDTTDAAPAPPAVQVRYYSMSPSVAVVAWDPAEAAYGLRSTLRRDGSLVRDHRVFVRTYYHPEVRSFPRAVVPFMPLLTTGVSRDDHACYFGRPCSPHETFQARIPDDFLRTAGDSVPVKFYDYRGRELTVTLRRDLIVAYLAAVDSTSAQLTRHR